MNKSEFSRRRFLKSASQGIALSSLIPLCNLASAQEQVPETDPTALALSYKHDATQTAAPAGRTCTNCILYSGAADAEWGPCSLFQNRLVAAKGWCSAWSAKL